MTGLIEEKKEIIQLRKSRSSLSICGKSIFILLIWSLIRFLMSSFMNDNSTAYFEEAYETTSHGSGLLYWAEFMVIALVITAIYGFVSLSAVAEAKGKKKGWFYLVICFFFLCMSVYGIYDYLFVPRAYVSKLDSIASVFVELISLLVEGNVILQSIRVKKLRKLTEREGK